MDEQRGYRFNLTAALVPLWLGARGFLLLQVVALFLYLVLFSLMDKVINSDNLLVYIVVPYGILCVIEGAVANPLLRYKEKRGAATKAGPVAIVLGIAVLAVVLWQARRITRHDYEAPYLGYLRADLHNLVFAEEAYFATAHAYTVQPHYDVSDGVRIRIDSATATGWGAEGTHRDLPGWTCRVGTEANVVCGKN